MKKASYFQIKSKIYHYYLAAVVMIFIMLGTILSIVVAREIVQSANKGTTKMVYDNGNRKFDEPVYVKIANVSKVLFYQKPERHRAEAFYFEVTDTDNNKFIMCAANDKGIEKAIEIKEALAKNAYNKEFFVYAKFVRDLNTLPSINFAPLQLGVRLSLVFPMPLPPEVANGMMVLPVRS